MLYGFIGQTVFGMSLIGLSFLDLRGHGEYSHSPIQHYTPLLSSIPDSSTAIKGSSEGFTSGICLYSCHFTTFSSLL